MPRLELAAALCSLLAAHVHVAAGNTTHIKRAASCGGDRFQCTDGSCLDSGQVCNRNPDCPDGSDELPDACLNAFLPVVSNYIGQEVLVRSARCPPGSYQCPTGQCIGRHLVCDGRNDCPVGADERLPQCRTAQPLCSPGEFRCSSGLCIPPASVCNGVRDCSGGDDEDPGLCGSRSNVGSHCLYPPYPEHGSYVVLDCKSCSPIPGTPLPPGASSLQYSCSPIYELKGANVLTCRDGKWSTDPPTCEPPCGKVRSGVVTYISGGMVAGAKFPWHVAIYNNEEYNCGGSLISLKYVLSAAHCFWNEGTKKKRPTEVFRVIAGKLYRSYTMNELGQQERAVQEIAIPTTYHGSQLAFQEDIAVLTVASPFQLSDKVGPVCVDWDGSKDVSPGDMGHIAGWGATEAGTLSEVLLSAELPVIDRGECLENIKEQYRASFGGDKICTGFRNGTTVCRGDSGGGLTFVRDISPLGASTKLYFVQGVVSLGIPSDSGCNLRNYVAFTKVSTFLNFLRNVTFGCENCALREF